MALIFTFSFPAKAEINLVDFTGLGQKARLVKVGDMEVINPSQAHNSVHSYKQGKTVKLVTLPQHTMQYTHTSKVGQ